MRIIVADDEFYARKALVKKIMAVMPDAEILEDFEDGTQVVDFMDSHPGETEVVLTDVRMPEMDGLMVAQYVSKLEHKPAVIIVSGYSEFEYARKAVQYGVSDYLLKPVQKKELQEALEKIAYENTRYRENVRRIVQDQMVLKTVQYLSIEELVNHVEWSRRFLEPAFMGEDKKQYLLAVLQTQEELSGPEQKKLSEALESLAKGFCGTLFYFNRYQEYVLILFSDESQKKINEQLQPWIKKYGITHKVFMTAGISQKYSDISGIKKAYREAVYAINQRLIDGWGKTYSYTGEIKPLNLFSKESETLLRESIEQSKCEQAGRIIADLLESCKDSYTLYVTIGGIFNLLYNLYCKSSRSEEHDSDHGYMLFSFRSDLYAFRGFQEVKQYVLQIVSAMCQEQEEKQYHQIIREVLNYIEKNYQDNISLSELAEHKYFMSGSYLSRLFKNEVGQTFSGYLMEFRIRKAARLLESDLLRLNDIAMLSGYNDVSHFIQYFRKFFGCTPEEYRAKKAKEREKQG